MFNASAIGRSDICLHSGVITGFSPGVGCFDSLPYATCSFDMYISSLKNGMWISKLSDNTYYSICICIVFKNPSWELLIFFWEFVTLGSRRHPLQPRSQVKPHFFSADAFEWGDSVYNGLKGIISKNANTNYQLVIYSRTVHIISAVG